MPFSRYTKKSFEVKGQAKWGNKYNYELVNYVNSRTKVRIICNKHGLNFEQTPKAHLMAKHECCPVCYKEIAGSFQNAWRKSRTHVSNPTRLQQINHIINQVFCDI